MASKLFKVLKETDTLHAVFICNLRSANNEAKVAARNIESIVCVMKVDQKDYKCRKFVKNPDNDLLICPVENLENSDISRFFFTAAKFIHNKRKTGNVLVHCDGLELSRSSSIILAYLIICEGYLYKLAFELLQKKYQFAQPNFGFKTQLLELEKFKQINFSVTEKEHEPDYSDMQEL